MGKLDGKVAVITGGASGIGAATVRLFACEGARVVIADVLEEIGANLAKELGDAATFVRTDVRHEADIERAIAAAGERFGRLDCLFNNAGFGGVEGPIAETETEALDTTMAVLFRAVALGMKHAAPILLRQASGTILSTASIAGLEVGHSPHVYAAAKAAVIHLTRSVAKELGEGGVRVNCICPGAIATPIFGRSSGLSEEDIEAKRPLVEQALAMVQPLRRTGQPLDIARAALWLASDDSSFVNGAALVVDGGLTYGRTWTESRAGRSMMRSLLGLED